VNPGQCPAPGSKRLRSWCGKACCWPTGSKNAHQPSFARTGNHGGLGQVGRVGSKQKKKKWQGVLMGTTPAHARRKLYDPQSGTTLTLDEVEADHLLSLAIARRRKAGSLPHYTYPTSRNHAPTTDLGETRQTTARRKTGRAKLAGSFEWKSPERQGTAEKKSGRNGGGPTPENRCHFLFTSGGANEWPISTFLRATSASTYFRTVRMLLPKNQAQYDQVR